MINIIIIPVATLNANTFPQNNDHLDSIHYLLSIKRHPTPLAQINTKILIVKDIPNSV